MASDASVGELRDVALAALREADLLGSGEPTFEPLAGGVSNDVVVVRTAESVYVVKRALPQLRVAEVWEASADRSFTEASALRWAHRVTPTAVPEVVTVDRKHNVLVIQLAPPSYANWKQLLLDGDVQPEVGSQLGTLLASWHVASALAPEVKAEFDNQEAFAQLRVTPFYRVAAERNPQVAPVILDLAEQLASTRSTVVHGDFSPKNILVDPNSPSRLWVIDWEVAHLGDPVFDVAFLLHHLVCKSIARPASRTEFFAVAEKFVGAYENGIHGELPSLNYRSLIAHTGALVLARVDGKSPVDYFSTDERTAARALALTVLHDSPSSLTELWSLTDAR